MYFQVIFFKKIIATTLLNITGEKRRNFGLFGILPHLFEKQRKHNVNLNFLVTFETSILFFSPECTVKRGKT